MEFMTTKEAVQKWNISERRIRQLLQDGRIEGAVKVGNNWNIPINANKPADKRSVKLDNTEFKFDLPDNYFDKVDELNKKLNSKRPISKETLKSLKESINLEWTYNSNGIEGNTLTLRETQVVLEGITVGGKSLKEHLEVINHEQAILFLDDLIKDKEPITEWNIKNIHQLVLKEIDDDNAGKYRDENVKIKGATHIPPDYLIVPELMEKLIINYEDWKKYHPIIRAALLHGELVKIHPFVDGNGRTGRTLIHKVLRDEGVLTYATLPVSAGLLHNIDAYLDSIAGYQQGDIAGVVSQLADALELSCQVGYRASRELDATMEEWESTMTERRGSRIRELPALLVRQPVVDVAFVARELSISPRAASSLVNKACEYGMIRPMGNRRRGEFYQSDAILAVLDQISDVQGIKRMLSSS